MSKKNSGRTIYHVPGKGWADKANDAIKPAKFYGTQAEAYEAGRQRLINQGGGEIAIKNKTTGKIRQKTTIPHGNDPYPPKG
jgi:hypothetical protein